MPKVHVNNIDIYYEADGAGPPLVLVHGHTLNLRLWDAQVPPLARDHRVLRYDVRGHGRSESPPTGYAWPIYAEDLAALLDYAGLERVGVIGHSMGGAIAIEFALRYPERVSSLVLCGAVVEGYAFSDAWRSFWKPFAEVIRRQGARTAIEGLWMDHPIFATLRRSPAKFYAFRDIALTYEGGEYLAKEPTRISRAWRQTDRLGEIKAPALILIGELDLPDLQGIAGVLAQGIPGAEKRVMPNVGHMANLEEPGLFNAALREFLLEVERRQG